MKASSQLLKQDNFDGLGHDSSDVDEKMQSSSNKKHSVHYCQKMFRQVPTSAQGFGQRGMNNIVSIKIWFRWQSSHRVINNIKINIVK